MMISRRTTWLAATYALALPIALAACGGGAEPAPASTTAAEPAARDRADRGAQGEQDPAAQSEEPIEMLEVELVGAGADERHELRFDWPSEGTVRTRMVTQMGLTMVVDGKAMPSPTMPPFAMTFRLDHEPATPQGHFPAAFAIESVDVMAGDQTPPEVVAALERELGKQEGTNGRMTTTARGLLAEFDVDVPEAAGEKLQQLVDEVTRAARQMSPPFPEQPVGLGAQWSTTDEVQVSGFPLEQTSVYELTSFEDGKGTLEYEATQSAPSTDTLDIPGLPPGQTVRLESLTGSGTGRIEFDLSSPVTRTELCYSSSFSAVLVSDKGETPMTIEVEWSSLVHPSGDEVEGPADCDHSDATSATADSGS